MTAASICQEKPPYLQNQSATTVNAKNNVCPAERLGQTWTQHAKSFCLRPSTAGSIMVGVLSGFKSVRMSLSTSRTGCCMRKAWIYMLHPPVCLDTRAQVGALPLCRRGDDLLPMGWRGQTWKPNPKATDPCPCP